MGNEGGPLRPTQGVVHFSAPQQRSNQDQVQTRTHRTVCVEALSSSHCHTLFSSQCLCSGIIRASDLRLLHSERATINVLILFINDVGRRKRDKLTLLAAALCVCAGERDAGKGRGGEGDRFRLQAALKSVYSCAPSPGRPGRILPHHFHFITP